MRFLDANNPFSPFYRVQIRTAEQARIYNRFLIAKIVVLVIILSGLLALSGWSAKMLAFGLAFAAVWKGLEFYLSNRHRTMAD